jgi:hypothetical protein
MILEGCYPVWRSNHVRKKDLLSHLEQRCMTWYRVLLLAVDGIHLLLEEQFITVVDTEECSK